MGLDYALVKAEGVLVYNYKDIIDTSGNVRNFGDSYDVKAPQLISSNYEEKELSRSYGRLNVGGWSVIFHELYKVEDPRYQEIYEEFKNLLNGLVAMDFEDDYLHDLEEPSFLIGRFTYIYKC